ncbi:uncharacterized protein LOC143145986 isoform X3 [Ptiloglossa arizonensis]|uniref:uncharacterized protein LOC143145986 isoform X3 n=1 Tax=Ptiloglossa arizonensis TaxID=3350558 RepID=UPI003FA09F53
MVGFRNTCYVTWKKHILKIKSISLKFRLYTKKNEETVSNPVYCFRGRFPCRGLQTTWISLLE